MSKRLFFLLAISCILTNVGAQDVNWIIREGGVSYERSQSIAVDQNNYLYVTGGYNGNSIIGQQVLPVYGDEDIFISKYDQNGDPKWVVTAGGPNQDLPFSIHIDHDLNIYVTGFYNETCTFGDTTLSVPENDQIFLVKYDSAGVFQWVRHGGSYNQNWGKTVEIDSENNVIIAGFIGANATFGDTTILGSNTMFIAKYNSNGDLLFAKSGDGYSGINALCTDDNNRMYATGNYHGELVLDSISVHGNFITSFFIASFNADGKTQWIYDDGGKISGDGTTLILDHNNDICFTYLFFDSTTIAGNHYISNGNYDLILGKISSSGNLIWHKHIGGQNLWHDKTIAVDSFNNIYLTGSISGTDYFEGIPFTAQDEDVFIAKFDPEGEFRWLIQGTGIDQDQGSGICFNESNGTIYSTGSFNYSMELGGKTVLANGDADFFLDEISLLTGLNETKTSNTFLFYPNPTTGVIRNNVGNIISIEVYDEKGDKIIDQSNFGEIDLTNKPAGIYFIKTITSKETIVQKIIKQ